MSERVDCDVVVIGGGPAGLTAAILLAQTGLQTVLIRKLGPPDGKAARTTALLAGSVALLTHIGAWTEIEPHTAPLKVMRLVDDTGRLFRAPTVNFAASELGLDAFGHNVPNHELEAGLERVAARQSGLGILDTIATSADLSADRVQITTAAGMIVEARLAVAADGRDSAMRQTAGIPVSAWRYDQTALTLNLDHDAPHRGISTEFHRTSGPFTLVPLPGNRSSLVAVCRPADAERLYALDDGALMAELETRAHAILGRFRPASRRAIWPLTGLRPHIFAKSRVVLIGEAAHVMPPIGAQGLNLGLRDAAALAELAGDAKAAGEDLGGEALLSAYTAARRADVMIRIAGVDVLNRTLLSPFLPGQALRGLGLFLAEQIGPLRRALLREGLQPDRFAPSIMRGVV